MLRVPNFIAPPRALPPRVGRYLVALGVVAVATGVAELIFRVFGTDRLAVVFLTAVVVVGTRFGTGPAYLAGLASVAMNNIYLTEPRFRFSTFTHEDYLVLALFALVAALSGRLTGRLHAALARSRCESRDRARLLEASRSFHAAASEPALLADLTARLREVAGAPVPIFPPAAHEGGVRLEAGPVPAEARPVADLMLELAAGALSRIRAAEQRVELRTMERTAEFRQAVLSSVSHDLRTPLATILTSASTLRAFGDTLPEETVARAYADIEGEALRMNRFIVGLLDMIRVDGGGLEPDLHALDVLEVLDRCLGRPDLKALQMVRTWPADPVMVLADPLLLERALENVLDNAWRYAGAAGPVEVAVAAGAGTVTVRITDSGPGLPVEALGRMFDKFYRGSAAGRGDGGAGLGLSIARGFVEAMGGRVAAMPGPAGGLRLQLELPAAPTPIGRCA
ncbi:MAG: ATP-binding protein [Brevundimonas sp.]